ncbi:putative TonB-dependent transporter [Xanthomonas citri pv. fuscans]|nr:putative TonB-dependent transporter [Xanthomonas citri pv. fuscans]
MTCTQATLLSLSVAVALGCIGAARAQQTATVQATEATTLDQVLVSGRLRSLEQFTPTGSRLNLSARETPGTLDAINAAAIEARGLRSVEKAAESLPGINTGGSPGNPATFSMRGFTDGQITILHNGLYLGPSNMTNRPQNTFNLQSVEVLKGPASVIYGQGAVGGAVNVTNKAPTFGPAQYELLLGASSYGGRVFGVGAGGGINDDWAYRADISLVSSDGYVHGADSSALNATVSLLWHPREDISAQFSLDYAKDQPSTYFGTPLLPAAAARTPINGILRAPNGEVVDAATRRNNYNVADASIDARQLWPQAYLKWKVTDAVTVQNMAYYFHADRRWINAENYTYNPQSARIERDRFFVYHQQTLWGNQTSATFDQRIAGLKNRLVVGLRRRTRSPNAPLGPRVSTATLSPSGKPRFLSKSMVTTDPVLRLPTGDPQGDLYDQRHRVGQHEPAQADQEPRRVPQRRSLDETVLPGSAQHHQEMDAADPRLEGCAEPLYDPVRGATSSAVTQTTVTQNSAHAPSKRSSAGLW